MVGSRNIFRINRGRSNVALCRKLCRTLRFSGLFGTRKAPRNVFGTGNFSSLLRNTPRVFSRAIRERRRKMGTFPLLFVYTFLSSFVSTEDSIPIQMALNHVLARRRLFIVISFVLLLLLSSRADITRVPRSRLRSCLIEPRSWYFFYHLIKTYLTISHSFPCRPPSSLLVIFHNQALHAKRNSAV